MKEILEAKIERAQLELNDLAIRYSPLKDFLNNQALKSYLLSLLDEKLLSGLDALFSTLPAKDIIDSIKLIDDKVIQALESNHGKPIGPTTLSESAPISSQSTGSNKDLLKANSGKRKRSQNKIN